MDNERSTKSEAYRNYAYWTIKAHNRSDLDNIALIYETRAMFWYRVWTNQYDCRSYHIR